MLMFVVLLILAVVSGSFWFAYTHFVDSLGVSPHVVTWAALLMAVGNIATDGRLFLDWQAMLTLSAAGAWASILGLIVGKYQTGVETTETDEAPESQSRCSGP